MFGGSSKVSVERPRRSARLEIKFVTPSIAKLRNGQDRSLQIILRYMANGKVTASMAYVPAHILDCTTHLC